MKTRLLIAVVGMAFATCALGASPTVLKLQKGGTTVPTTTPVGGAPLTTLEQDPAMRGVGIEVNTGRHTAEEARQYADVAPRYGFLASRGSDFHSPKESRMDLGRLPALPSDLKPVWHDWF